MKNMFLPCKIDSCSDKKRYLFKIKINKKTKYKNLVVQPGACPSGSPKYDVIK